MRCVYKRQELRLSAEARVELVSGSVLVPVVRRRRKDRLQIDHRHAEVLQIVETLRSGETAEIAKARGNRAHGVEVGIAPGDRHDLINDFILRRAHNGRRVCMCRCRQKQGGEHSRSGSWAESHSA